MARPKALFRVGFITILIFSIFLCSFTGGSSHITPRSNIQGTIVFTPSIPTLESKPLGTPNDFNEVQRKYPTATVVGDSLVIGSNAYPIGEPFAVAEGIPLGSVENDLFGEFGYSTILADGASEYRLVWMTDESFNKYFMIVKEDNPLFSGPDGFKDQFDKLIKVEDTLRITIEALVGATVSVVILDMGFCPVTAGATCAKALVVIFLGGIGAGLTAIWYFLFDVLPAMENVRNAFVNYEINQP